jgi:hypothetical protein
LKQAFEGKKTVVVLVNGSHSSGVLANHDPMSRVTRIFGADDYGSFYGKNFIPKCSDFTSFAFFGKYMCNESLPAQLIFSKA